MNKLACRCAACQDSCKTRPGFFAPGEAERTAKALGMTLRAFFDKYLVVERAPDWPDAIGVLVPASTNTQPGGLDERPDDPSLDRNDPRRRGRGRCIFLGEYGLCKIHRRGKPEECRRAHHALGEKKSQELHEQVGNRWATPAAQAQIAALLSNNGA